MSLLISIVSENELFCYILDVFAVVNVAYKTNATKHKLATRSGNKRQNIFAFHDHILCFISYFQQIFDMNLS